MDVMPIYHVVIEWGVGQSLSLRQNTGLVVYNGFDADISCCDRVGCRAEPIITSKYRLSRRFQHSANTTHFDTDTTKKQPRPYFPPLPPPLKKKRRRRERKKSSSQPIIIPKQISSCPFSVIYSSNLVLCHFPI
jgi:hypothetical protein